MATDGSEQDGLSYVERYGVRGRVIGAIIGTLFIIGVIAVIWVLDLDRNSSRDLTLNQITTWALVALAAVGIIGVAHSVLLATMRRVALRADQDGLSIVGRHPIPSIAERDAQQIPWDAIDRIVLSTKSYSAYGSSTHLDVLVNDGSAGSPRSHHVFGHRVDLARLYEVASTYSPSIRVERRRVEDGAVKIVQSLPSQE